MFVLDVEPVVGVIGFRQRGRSVEKPIQLLDGTYAIEEQDASLFMEIDWLKVMCNVRRLPLQVTPNVVKRTLHPRLYLTFPRFAFF